MVVTRLFPPLCLFFGLTCFSVAQNDQPEKWVNALGSDDFETREAAMTELWTMGDDALGVLELLKDRDDPEIMSRAKLLWRKITLGITPGTPAKLEKLLVEYLTGNPTQRLEVLGKLKDEREYDYILRLRRDESDPKVLRALNLLIAQIIPEIVASAMLAGEIEDAKEVLRQSNQYEHLIHLGQLLKLEEKLDAEIEKLKVSETPEDKARYLAYLRVKGDAGLLRSEASRLGDRNAESVAALAQGDFEPYFLKLLSGKTITPATRLYLEAVMAESRNDEGLAKAKVARLVDSLDRNSASLAAQLNLFRLGHGNLVIENLPPRNFRAIVRFHEFQEDYVRVEEVLELPESGQFEAWLEKWKNKADSEGGRQTLRPSFDRLTRATGFLEGRGQLDRAAKTTCALFDITRVGGTIPKTWKSSLFFTAPISVLTAMAREIDEFDAGPSMVIKELTQSTDYHYWLFSLLGEEEPEMTTRDRLLTTYSFSSRYPLIPAARYDEFFEKIFQRILKSEDKVEDLDKLLRLVLQRNRGEEIRRVLEAKADAGVPEDYRLALLNLDSGFLDEAAKGFKSLVDEEDEVSPLFLFLTGLTMVKAGLEGGESVLETAWSLGDGGGEMLEAFAEHHLHLGNLRESHEILKQALLRIPSLPSPGNYSGSEGLIESLAAGAAALGEWKEALAFRQAHCLLASYSSGLDFGHFYTRHRFEVLVARAALAMKNGDMDKAAADFTEAHRILPRDGYLANELFPVMREVGMTELHDELFAESAEHAREMIRLYPKDDNVYNNFAWMASRANRCLDEAEAYLKTALEMNPQSAAYLDTMGEIYFARRNRAEAVKWSDRSLENETFGSAQGRWELHQQHRRFQSGPFPPK